MHCYHHNDSDGLAAGYIVKTLCDNMNIPYTEEDFSCVDYNSEFNNHANNEDYIFIVDLSFTKDTGYKLINCLECAKKVIWVDHHTSSGVFINSSKFKESILNKFDNLFTFFTESSCGALNIYRLTHNLSTDEDKDMAIFYFYQALKPETKSTVFELEELTMGQKFKVPLWLSFIDDYDRWVHKLPNTKYFQLGMMANNNDLVISQDGHTVFNSFWNELTKPEMNKVTRLIEEGKAIDKYNTSRYTRELKKMFVVTLPSRERILCKNGYGNSDVFLDKISEYDAVSIFHYNGGSGNWYHSVYSYKDSKFDCSKFAEQYGGGGHFHAAGFNIDRPIWTTDFSR